MKTNKVVLKYFSEVLFNDNFNIDKVIRLNKARNCLIEILSGYNNIDEGFSLVLLAFIDNKSLMLFEKNTEDLYHQKHKFRISLLKLL